MNIRTIFYYEDSEAKPAADVQDEMYSSGSEESENDALRSERVTGVRNAYFSEPLYSETHASQAYYCTVPTFTHDCIATMCDMTAAVFALLQGP